MLSARQKKGTVGAKNIIVRFSKQPISYAESEGLVTAVGSCLCSYGGLVVALELTHPFRVIRDSKSSILNVAIGKESIFATSHSSVASSPVWTLSADGSLTVLSDVNGQVLSGIVLTNLDAFALGYTSESEFSNCLARFGNSNVSSSATVVHVMENHDIIFVGYESGFVGVLGTDSYCRQVRLSWLCFDETRQTTSAIRQLSTFRVSSFSMRYFLVTGDDAGAVTLWSLAMSVITKNKEERVGNFHAEKQSAAKLLCSNRVHQGRIVDLQVFNIESSKCAQVLSGSKDPCSLIVTACSAGYICAWLVRGNGQLDLLASLNSIARDRSHTAPSVLKTHSSVSIESPETVIGCRL